MPRKLTIRRIKRAWQDREAEREKEKKMPFEKLQPVKKLYIGCLTCSTASRKAPMGMWVAVGFGSAYVTKDGDCVYEEPRFDSEEEPKTVFCFELMAQKDPDHDWRIVKYGPLHGETFQRQGYCNWVCVESNEGFA